MAAVRMVHLRTVPNTFHARVIAARLGADGIMAQLRGSVDGPYPIGDVMVFVDEHDLDAARELLLADELEAAYAGNDEPEQAPSPVRRAAWATWVIAALLLAVWATVSMRVV